MSSGLSKVKNADLIFRLSDNSLPKKCFGSVLVSIYVDPDPAFKDNMDPDPDSGSPLTKMTIENLNFTTQKSRAVDPDYLNPNPDPIRIQLLTNPYPDLDPDPDPGF